MLDFGIKRMRIHKTNDPYSEYKSMKFENIVGIDEYFEEA